MKRSQQTHKERNIDQKCLQWHFVSHGHMPESTTLEGGWEVGGMGDSLRPLPLILSVAHTQEGGLSYLPKLEMRGL